MPKITRLQNREQAEAFMIFLARESQRHARVMANIFLDMERVSEQWGIEIPVGIDDAWIDVSGKPSERSMAGV